MALLKDVFYPGNPARRDKVASKYQELLSCVKQSARATNKLASYMKENYSVKSTVGRIVHTYNELTLKEGSTIKENCDMFIKEAEKLQMAVTEVSKNTLAHIHTQIRTPFFKPTFHCAKRCRAKPAKTSCDNNLCFPQQQRIIARKSFQRHFNSSKWLLSIEDLF